MTRRAWLVLGSAGAILALIVTVVPIVALGQSGPYVIAPGRSLGPIELGMRIDEVVALLGTPLTKACDDPRPGCQYWWQGYDDAGNLEPGSSSPIQVHTMRGVVDEISVNDRRYITTRGIHVEMTEQQVRRILGPPRRFEDHTYIRPGHPSCCYVHILRYPGLQIETGYAPGICRNLRNPACWVVGWITIVPIDGSPRT